MRYADIVVSTPDETLQLVVEIKNKHGASTEWVTRMRRNLLAHSFMPRAPYFLLVLPDFLYLWKDSTPVNNLAQPDYKVETTKVLAPYLKSSQTLIDLNGYSLELLTISWLDDLVSTDVQRDSVDPDHQWLFDSGLYEAITHGSIEPEVAT